MCPEEYIDICSSLTQKKLTLDSRTEVQNLSLHGLMPVKPQGPPGTPAKPCSKKTLNLSKLPTVRPETQNMRNKGKTLL